MIQSLSSAQPALPWARSRAIFPPRARTTSAPSPSQAAVERSGVDKNLVEHVYFGNCLMAGQGQAPARQAAIKAGLPLSAGAVTLVKNVRLGDADHDFRA